MSISRQYRLYIWYMILDQITSVFDLKVRMSQNFIPNFMHHLKVP